MNVDKGIGVTGEEMTQLMLLHEQDIRNQENIGSEDLNPDRMTYEQLLELEEGMGKVSKGLKPNELLVFINK